MKAIGRPETGSGDQVKAEIDQFADTTKSSVDAIKTEAESLQDEGVVAFAAGAASIAGELDTIVQTGKTTLSDIEQIDASGELKTAIENDSTCQSLTSSSDS